MHKAITRKETTYFNEFAEFAKSITEEDWAFFDFADDISDQIHDHMNRQGITKADLAEKMKSSRAFITKVLRGDANMTFKTFTKLLFHLDAKAEIKIVRQNDGIQWMGLVSQKREKQPERASKKFNKIEASSSGCVVGKKELEVA